MEVEAETRKKRERLPLILAYDGKKIHHALCLQGREIVINDQSYIIDRNIDDNSMTPNEKFAARMLDEYYYDYMFNHIRPEHFFQEVFEYFERYFYFEKPYLYIIATLFAVNTWVFDAHDSTPYLFISSENKGCGKKHLGESIASMTNGIIIDRLNADYIFRQSHGSKTTLVFNEIKRLTNPDTILSQDSKDVLSLICAGHQRHGSETPRVNRISIAGTKTHRMELWDSYTPKVLITTGGAISDSLLSNCIELRMLTAPLDGAPYDERWVEKERRKRLKNIRQMGLLFRLKYAREIKTAGQDDLWRKKMDRLKLFDGIRIDDMELFRPLLVLTMKYLPKWNDYLNHYIREYAGVETDYTPVRIIPQRQMIDRIRNMLIDSKNGLTWPEIKERCKGLVSDGQINAILNHFIERGFLVKHGNAYVWIG